MSPGLLGAIFDVDGVLLATPHERAWRESLQDLMGADWADLVTATDYAPERFTSALYQELIAGKPRFDGARAALEHFRVPEVDARVLEYADAKQARLMELIKSGAFAAFPDGVRFALALKMRGLRLAAASSSKNARDLLQQVRLAPYPTPQIENELAVSQHVASGATLLDLMDVDVSGRDLPHGKPHPAIFLLAAEELGLAPAVCLVVEDAPAGIAAAKAGGMAALGVARAGDQALLSAAGADLVVSTLDEVDVEQLMAGRGSD